MEILGKLKDERFRLVRLDENHGAAAARNAGVRASRGEFVAFQDSDDVWKRNKLEKQIAIAFQTNADIVLCRLERHGYPKGVSRIVPNMTLPAGIINYEQVLTGGLFAPPASLVKRSVFEYATFDEGLRFCEDEEWAIRAAFERRVVLMDDILGDVFLQGDSVTLQNHDLNRIRLETLLERFHDQYEQYPSAHGAVLGKLADAMTLEGDKATAEYQKAFSLDHDPKKLLKYCLASIGVLHMIMNGRMSKREYRTEEGETVVA